MAGVNNLVTVKGPQVAVNSDEDGNGSEVLPRPGNTVPKSKVPR
jgi:hypothetical protein